jgi:hypothetical protein
MENSIARPLKTVLSENDIETRYIRHFQHRTTSGFEGVMDWSIWNHIIMQHCHQDQFVYDSVVAIGALIRSVETKSQTVDLPLRKNTMSGIAKVHKEYAFSKYDKALRTMQTSLIGAETRKVLIACLLVFCFEALLENRHLALSHAISGHHILRDWLGKYKGTRLSKNIILSPAPVAIEDELVEAFEHLDLQISTIYDVRPVSLHRSVLEEGREAIQNMSPCFNNIKEARRYLNLVMRRAHHFLAVTWSASEASLLSREFKMKPPGDITVTTGVNIYSTSYKVDENIRAEQKIYAEEISRWKTSFQALYQTIQLSEASGSRNHTVATMLQIHLIATQIVISGVLFTTELEYDGFLPQFRELFELITLIVSAHHLRSKHVHAEGGFLLDMGILTPLFLLVARCRDRVLRRKAIAISREWHMEACWNPGKVAEIGKFMMEVEEDGVIDDIIPERSRTIISRVSEAPGICKHGKQEILVQCVQRYGGENGQPVWTEKLLCYA